MPRPKVHDEALRSRLLEQAVLTLSQGGPEELSLRKLAAQVGTSTTAVYSLFGGKPALLRAVFEEALDRFSERFLQVPATDDPLADVAALALACRVNALEEPHFYQVLFGHTSNTVSLGEKTLQRAKETFRPLVAAVRRAIEASQLRAENPALIAANIWATAHGMLSLELNGLLPPSAGDPLAAYQQAVTAVCAGWRPHD